MDLAVRLDETGTTHSFSFENGRIMSVGNDSDAEFLISAPENIWRAVFNRVDDPSWSKFVGWHFILLAVACVYHCLNSGAGFIKTLGGFLGSLIGFVVAGFVMNWAHGAIPLFSSMVAALIGFVLLAFLISQLIQFVFGIVDKAYKLLSILGTLG